MQVGDCTSGLREEERSGWGWVTPQLRVSPAPQSVAFQNQLGQFLAFQGQGFIGLARQPLSPWLLDSDGTGYGTFDTWSQSGLI